MSAAERRIHKGRSVITRAALMREARVGQATAEGWYRSRARNGHPEPVLAAGQLLYFDEAALLAWVHAQLDPPASPPRIVRVGRVLVTRAELARLTGLSEIALRDIYANRATTGHPEVAYRDPRHLYFDERDSLEWHAARLAAARTAAARGRHRCRVPPDQW